VIVRAAHQKGRRDRVLPLSDQAVSACIRLHQHTCQCKLLFPCPYRREWLWRRFRAIVEAAGLTTPRGRMGLFHRLRRTSGSLVEANGGDGSRHLGNTRAVFERSYLDPRIIGRGQVELLPRPVA
jgi:integrase